MKVKKSFEFDSPDTPIFLGTDQPETCRKCGARTDFDELTSTRQIHRCFICANQYFVEFEDEECHACNDN